MSRGATAAAGLALVALAACGSTGDPPARSTAAGPAPLATYDERADDRLVVARVDGVPVYGDCVAAQAAGLPLGDDAARAAALEQCVAFELLAQEARRRGLLSDRDAVEAQRREAVRALIATDFGPTLDRPEDIGDDELRRLWPQLKRFYDRPEVRAALYCRARVGRKHKRGGPEDQAARALGEELAAGLRRARPASAAEFTRSCRELAGPRPVEASDRPYRFANQGDVDRVFGEAAFSLGGAGEMAGPVRTYYGWDIIYLTDVEPAVRRSLEQAADEIRDLLFYDEDFDGYRQSRFLAWAARLAQGARVEVFAARIPPPTDDDALGAQPAVPPPARDEAP
jgi:hypothetical protein